MAGVVFYEANEIGCFENETAIEPANCFAIPHSDLAAHVRRGSLEVLHVLDGFKARIELAIAASKSIEPRRKAKLIALVNGEPI
jgi:hypothetical protein